MAQQHHLEQTSQHFKDSAAEYCSPWCQVARGSGAVCELLQLHLHCWLPCACCFVCSRLCPFRSQQYVATLCSFHAILITKTLTLVVIVPSTGLAYSIYAVQSMPGTLIQLCCADAAAPTCCAYMVQGGAEALKHTLHTLDIRPHVHAPRVWHGLAQIKPQTTMNECRDRNDNVTPWDACTCTKCELLAIVVLEHNWPIQTPGHVNLDAQWLGLIRMGQLCSHACTQSWHYLTTKPAPHIHTHMGGIKATGK
jgi:hypothetical protein